MDQKKKDPQCICIQVLYREGDRTARIAGRNAANIASIYSDEDNLEECCPKVTARVHYKSVPGKQWDEKVLGRFPPLGIALVDGKVSDSPEINAMKDQAHNFPEVHKPNCINMFIGHADPSLNELGVTAGNGPRPTNPPTDPPSYTSTVVVMANPDASTQATIGAHEIGHSLGLDHDDDSDNLMHPSLEGQDDTELDSDQCRTIWQNIKKYACD